METNGTRGHESRFLAMVSCEIILSAKREKINCWDFVISFSQGTGQSLTGVAAGKAEALRAGHLHQVAEGLGRGDLCRGPGLH